MNDQTPDEWRADAGMGHDETQPTASPMRTQWSELHHIMDAPDGGTYVVTTRTTTRVIHVPKAEQ